MNFNHRVRRPLLALVAVAFVFSTCAAALAAPRWQRSKPTSGGTGRQGNGQPLRVMVMMNGAPVAKASVVVSVGDGSVILRGVTKPNGTFTTMLDQGLYTVTASTPKGKATSPVTIVQSTDAATVPLTLAAQ